MKSKGFSKPSDVKRFRSIVDGWINIKEETNMARVTKDTMIGDLLQIDQNVAPLLLNIGMHCLGCPSSQMETIAEAAMVHGIDPDDLVVEINTFLDSDLG